MISLIMTLVKTCCWFYSLRTGALTTGCFSLLLSSAVSIGFTWLFAEQYNYNNKTFDAHVFIRFCASAGAVLGIFVSIFLLIGTVQGYPWLLLPWIGYTIINMPVLIPYVTLTLQHISWLFIFLLVTLLLVVIPLHFYLILVVISHFEELSMEKDRKKRERSGERF